MEGSSKVAVVLFWEVPFLYDTMQQVVLPLGKYVPPRQ
jgi:hypothetical protein